MAWALTYLLHSTLLLGAAWSLTRTPWGRSSSFSDAVWKGALFGALLTTTVQQRFGGPLSLVLPTFAKASAFAGASADKTAGTPVSAMVDAIGALAYPSVPWIALAWGLTSGFAAVRLALGWLQLRHATARRRVLASGPLRRELDAILADAGVRRSIVLSVSRGLAMPRAIGTREICVPIRVLRDLSAAEQRALLAHEAAHLLRRDGAWLFAAAMLQTLAWWQPLTRIAVARLREAMELCCDDWAVSRLSDRMALAECLVKVGEWGLPVPRGVPLAAFAHGSTLRARVERLIAGRPAEPRTHRYRWLAAAPLILVLGAAPRFVVTESRPAPVPVPGAIVRAPESPARLQSAIAASAPVGSNAAGAVRAGTPSAARPPADAPATLSGEPAAAPIQEPLQATGAVDVPPIVTMTDTLVQPTATLRLTGNVTRLVPPATPPPPPIVGKADRADRVVGLWVNYTDRIPSFDPYRPKYQVRDR